MNKVEMRFYDEFYQTMTLIGQPQIFKDHKLFWVPDFIDLKTNTYYEVVGTQSTFINHKKKNHFDFLVNEGYKLIIAIYVRRADKFVLFKYTNNYKLSKKACINSLIFDVYKRKYGETQPFLTPEQHEEMLYIKVKRKDFIRSTNLWRLS